MARKALERVFQAKLIKELKSLYPDAMITKMDGHQGWPDILILRGDRWASLECKREANADKQPNQEGYVERMNNMSFSRFIFPENKKEVLDDLEQALQPRRTTRSIRSKPPKLGDG